MYRRIHKEWVRVRHDKKRTTKSHDESSILYHQIQSPRSISTQRDKTKQKKEREEKRRGEQYHKRITNSSWYIHLCNTTSVYPSPTISFLNSDTSPHDLMSKKRQVESSDPVPKAWEHRIWHTQCGKRNIKMKRQA